MRELIVISALLAFAGGCGPEDDNDEDDPLGTLEYEIPTALFYRLDRRVDIVGVDPAVDRSGCGFLTDRAYDDLIDARDALDANAAYPTSECGYSVEGSVHLEGFTHSPFPCTWYCCHPELLPIAVVYFAAGSSLYGQTPNINGESYVALEPDVSCPE